MADEFFDDEQELMEAAGAAPQDPAASPAQRGPAPSREAARETSAPPFWMVVAIAAIALLLGMVIGYLIGASTALNALGSSGGAATQQSSDAIDSSEVLPEGHPQLDINEDGTASVATGDGASSAGSAQ